MGYNIVIYGISLLLRITRTVQLALDDLKSERLELVGSGFSFDQYARRPIGAFGGRVDRANALDQHGIVLGAPRQRPLRPRVIPAGGDAQHAAQRGHRVHGPVLAHEREPLDGIVFVSRANQAAAFDRISRSTLS